jgi:putative RNA 2'-phosphotransferase
MKPKQLSKTLCYVLRHRPDSVGITLEEGGWVNIDLLCQAMTLTREVLVQVAREDDKQRFELDGNKIRACQGHSVKIDLQYDPAKPPDILYHGTAKRNLGSILQKGLLKRNRHHVHMSTNKRTMIAVGARHGDPVLLQINAKQMHADGHEFFVTKNSVWLTNHIPPKYLSVLD